MDRNHGPDATALDRYWDGLLRGQPVSVSDAEVDPLSRAIVRRLAERPSAAETDAAMTHVWTRINARQNGRATYGSTARAFSRQPNPAMPARRTLTPSSRWQGTSRALGILSLAAVLVFALSGLVVSLAPAGTGWRSLFGPSSPNNAWPVERGNTAHTGFVDEPGLTIAPVYRWTYDAAGQVAAPPIVGVNRVYVATNIVIALDRATGLERWRYPTGGEVSALVLAGDRLFAAGTGGELISLDAETGTERWRAGTAPARGASVAVGDDSVYVMTRDGSLLAIDADDGRVQWQTSVGSDLTTASVSLDGDAIAVAIPNEGVSVYERADGTVRWHAAITSPYDGAIDPPVIAQGLVYVTSRDQIGTAPEGHLQAYDLATGVVVWTFTIPTTNGIVAAVAVTDDAVVVGGADRVLRALDPVTGAARWSVPAGATVLQPVTVGGTVAYVVGVDRLLRAFSLADGTELWQLKIAEGNLASGVVVAGDALLGSTADGIVVSLGRADE